MGMLVLIFCQQFFFTLTVDQLFEEVVDRETQLLDRWSSTSVLPSEAFRGPV